MGGGVHVLRMYKITIRYHCCKNVTSLPLSLHIHKKSNDRYQKKSNDNGNGITSNFSTLDITIDITYGR